MKKLTLAIAAAAFLLTGCRYEEPSLSLTNVEKRLRGAWTISSIYKNGEKTDAESPTLVESQYAMYEFYKTKTLLISYLHNDIVCKSSGSWAFGEKKKTIELILINQYYPISRSYEIVKFKNKELKVRFKDDDGVEWILILSLEQSFANYDI